MLKMPYVKIECLKKNRFNRELKITGKISENITKHLIDLAGIVLTECCSAYLVNPPMAR